jgi:hypothetical protein
VEIVTGEALFYNRRFEYRMSSGAPGFRITLADGRVIDGANVRGSLNRLQSITRSHLLANSQDREYAEQELFALYLSWLYGLPGVMLNRPTPQGLSGEWRHPSAWNLLAGQAGLSTASYKQSETRAVPLTDQNVRANCTVIVVNGVCCGAAVPAKVAAACKRLSELADTPLLGIDFRLTAGGEWIFHQATPFPDLRVGGEKFLDILAESFNS